MEHSERMPTLPSDERLVRTKFAQHLKGTRVELVERILKWAEGDRDRRWSCFARAPLRRRVGKHSERSASRQHM